MPAELVGSALSVTKRQAATGRMRKSKGAFVTDEIERVAKACDIVL